MLRSSHEWILVFMEWRLVKLAVFRKDWAQMAFLSLGRFCRMGSDDQLFTHDVLYSLLRVIPVRL